MMVVYHAAFDLSYFFGKDIQPLEGGWLTFQRLTAFLFLFLVGVSFVVSKNQSDRYLKRAYKRALKIIGCGMLITFVTYLIVGPDLYIRFGILHMIGVSLMLLPLFSIFKEWNALIGVLIIYGTKMIDFPNASTNLLLPIGITRADFASLDYYSLFPWFGIILIGFATGEFIYVRLKRMPRATPRWTRLMIIPAKKSLWIYMIHQPILIGILSLIYGYPF